MMRPETPTCHEFWVLRTGPTETEYTCMLPAGHDGELHRDPTLGVWKPPSPDSDWFLVENLDAT